MPETPDLTPVFDRLKPLLEPYAASLIVKIDAAQSYSLDMPYSQRYRRELFFGSVQTKKNYVSFYLMPVYMYADLLDGLSPALKQRMQGKSCFNFKRVDEPLFAELASLTRRSYERCRLEGLAP